MAILYKILCSFLKGHIEWVIQLFFFFYFYLHLSYTASVCSEFIITWSERRRGNYKTRQFKINCMRQYQTMMGLRRGSAQVQLEIREVSDKQQMHLGCEEGSILETNCRNKVSVEGRMEEWTVWNWRVVKYVQRIESRLWYTLLWECTSLFPLYSNSGIVWYSWLINWIYLLSLLTI